MTREKALIALDDSDVDAIIQRAMDRLSPLPVSGDAESRQNIEQQRREIFRLVILETTAALALPPPEAGAEPTRNDLGEQLTALAHQFDARQAEHEREIGDRDQVIATLVTNMRHGASAGDILKWYDREQHLVPMVHKQLAAAAGAEPTPVEARKWADNLADDLQRHHKGLLINRRHLASTLTMFAEAYAAQERVRWRNNLQTAAGAMRMVRDAVQESFGPIASLESEEAVLLRGPEPTHEAEAIIDALRRVAEQLTSARAAGAVETEKRIVGELREWADGWTDTFLAPLHKKLDALDGRS